jgi:tetratricopeptide (TPR) repeat protein
VDYLRALTLQVHEALKRYPYWLIIFEDVVTLSDIEHFVPQGPGLSGIVLYTSRDTRLLATTSRIDLSSGLTAGEAIELLEKLTGIFDKESAAKLAIALDRLPLAIQVAGRYIAHQRTELRRPGNDYTSYYHLHQSHLVALDVAQLAICEQHGISRTQYVAIQLSIEDLSPAGRGLLTFCSLFDYATIPEEMFRAYTSALKGQTDDLSIDSDEAVKSLRQHGLLILDSVESKTWSLHRVTYDYAWLAYRDMFFSSKSDLTFILKALSWLQQPAYLNGRVDNHELQKRIYFHAYIFLTKLTTELVGQPLPMEVKINIVLILLNWGNNICHLGEIRMAKILLDRAIDFFQHYNFEKHPGFSETLIALDKIHVDLDKAKEVNILLERVLFILKRYHGRIHFEMAIALINIGRAYGGLGDFKRQEASFKEALHILEYHARYDPDITITLIRLSRLCSDFGYKAEARKLLERVIHVAICYHGGWGRYKIEIGEILRDLDKTSGDLKNPQAHSEDAEIIVASDISPSQLPELTRGTFHHSRASSSMSPVDATGEEVSCPKPGCY